MELYNKEIFFFLDFYLNIFLSIFSQNKRIGQEVNVKALSKIIIERFYKNPKSFKWLRQPSNKASTLIYW